MRRSQRGSSLVEVLFALGILSLAVGPIVALTTGPARQSKVSGLAATAQIVARQALAVLASLPHDQLRSLRGKQVESVDGVTVPAGFPGALAIEVDDESREPGLLVVTATVTWTVRGAKARDATGRIVLRRLVACGEWGLVQPLSVQAFEVSGLGRPGVRGCGWASRWNRA